MSNLSHIELSRLKNTFANTQGFNTFDEFLMNFDIGSQERFDKTARYFYSQGFKDATQGAKIIETEKTPRS